MQKPNLAINMENTAVAKVLQGASFTVPTTIERSSPTGISSGLSPSNLFSTKAATVGGQIVTSFSDIAGNAVVDVAHPLLPGDVVACSAVSSSNITVTVTSTSGKVVTLPLVPATAVGGVILIYG